MLRAKGCFKKLGIRGFKLLIHVLFIISGVIITVSRVTVVTTMMIAIQIIMLPRDPT